MEVALPPTVTSVTPHLQKNSVIHYKALHHHIQWSIQVFPRETQSKRVKVIKFHAKNRHYCKLRLRFLKGYDMQKYLFLEVRNYTTVLTAGGR